MEFSDLPYGYWDAVITDYTNTPYQPGMKEYWINNYEWRGLEYNYYFEVV